MDKELDNVREISNNIVKDFRSPGLDGILNFNDINDLKQLKIYLAKKLEEIIEQDMNKLISLLYRIDVDEQKVKELFSVNNKNNIPSGLADLIIDRQLQKIIIREKYKSEKL